MVLFLTFYKAKHGPIHDFLQRKTGRGGGGQLTDMPNYIYRFYLKPFNHLVTLFLREGILHFAF